MNILSLLITGAIFVAIVALIIWVGIYIALPIILFMLVASAIGSIIKAFLPSKPHHAHHMKKHHNEENVIDVEFKEIK